MPRLCRSKPALDYTRFGGGERNLDTVGDVCRFQRSTGHAGPRDSPAHGQPSQRLDVIMPACAQARSQKPQKFPVFFPDAGNSRPARWLKYEWMANRGAEKDIAMTPSAPANETNSTRSSAAGALQPTTTVRQVDLVLGALRPFPRATRIIPRGSRPWRRPPLH